LKAKTRFYRLKEGKYALYIPTELHRDSQWPFKDWNAEVEIVVLPAKIDGLGKLLVKPLLKGEKTPLESGKAQG